MSAETCTLRIYHNIRGVQVFRLLWCASIFHSPQQPNSPFVYFRFCRLAIGAYRVLSGSLPSSLVTSTVSRYTSLSSCEATRSILPSCFSFPLFRNIQATLAYIPLCCKTQYLSSCLDFGKSVSSVCLWLSFSTLRELGCMLPSCSFPLQSRETEISD